MASGGHQPFSRFSSDVVGQSVALWGGGANVCRTTYSILLLPLLMNDGRGATSGPQNSTVG